MESHHRLSHATADQQEGHGGRLDMVIAEASSFPVKYLEHKLRACATQSPINVK